MKYSHERNKRWKQVAEEMQNGKLKNLKVT